jgi:branched-chain amino acid transport system substrate-binding protein
MAAMAGALSQQGGGVHGDGERRHDRPVLRSEPRTLDARHLRTGRHGRARGLEEGLDTWFFIMPDYAMGKSQVASITHILERNGGKVLGTVAHPLPGTSDFSSHLLRAQSSGADPLVTNAG